MNDLFVVQCGESALELSQNRDNYNITRRKISAFLGYDKEGRSISTLHRRHPDLNDFAVMKPVETDRGLQESFCYNIDGVLRICVYSSQPRAKELLIVLTDRMRSAIDQQQSVIAQQKAHIADLSEANTRLNLQYQQQHQERKQLKDHAANLEAVAKLQETPAGMIAADFLKALNKAVSSGTYAITKVHGKCAVDGIVIGVYDRDYLYIPPDTAADIYNEFGLITEIAPGVLARNLEQARVIQKRIPGKYPKRNIDGVKRECIAVYLSEIRKVMKL